mgnify:FL=1
MSNIRGPICLNCEKKKNAQRPTILGNQSGYICDECYKSNLWAREKDNQELHTSLDLQSLIKWSNI